jgi:putative transposase
MCRVREDGRSIGVRRRGRSVLLLVAYPPKVAVASLVDGLKGIYSQLVRRTEFTEVRQRVWGSHFWAPSYCAVG